MAKKVVIIGCGPSGMMAAIAAARAGAQVTILDSQKTPGRKLLMTGNSRCNLTSLAPHIEQKYQSGDAERVLPLVESVFGQFSVQKALDFFHRMGLLTMVEHDVYIYPLTGQAQSVLNILLEEMRELGVKIKFSGKAVRIRRLPSGSFDKGDGSHAGQAGQSIQGGQPGQKGQAGQTGYDGGRSGRWVVHTEGWHYDADSVILACGGKSFPQTGSDGSGYALAKDLGLKVTKTLPALTGISVKIARQQHTYQSLLEEQEMIYGTGAEAASSQGRVPSEQNFGEQASFGRGKDMGRPGKDFPGSLSGVRTNAGVSVFIDGIPADRDIGQLQFTATDISGIVVFQVSSKVSRALSEGKNVQIRLDLIPAFTEDEVETIIRHYKESHPQASLKMVFCGLLPQQLIPHVLKAAGLPSVSGDRPKASDMDPFFIRAFAETAKSLRLEAVGVRGFDSCQITAGGIDISQVDPQSLECVGEGLDGIYLAGEMLDVDGPCGGYNLQWAWSSGYVAGTHAAGRNFKS